MIERLMPPSPRVVAELRAHAERRLRAAEFDAWVSAPMSEAEAEGIDDLIRWYRRRYPTPEARWRQARLAYKRWAAAMPPADAPGNDEPDADSGEQP